MTAKTHEEMARVKGQNVLDGLRKMRLEAQARVDEFSSYVDSWERAMKDGDPRALTQAFVVIRAEEQVEKLIHLHSGSSHASTVRMLKRDLFALAAPGEED